ncbi:MAG: thiamine phosphate synthase [Desulfuromonadales bacterium]|nr:thiamine phosphate synthase [Desulfuromonadales bacterium]
MTIKRIFPHTDLYGITAEEYSRGRTNIEVTEELVRQGIRVIQYRAKEKSQVERYRECLALRKITRQAGVVFIVNDHIDLALAVEADGVHVGQNDLPVPVVRSLVGEAMLIGLSTHSPAQARAAVLAGADYLGVGPVFATATKKDVVSPVGLEYVKYVAENISLPFVAIGGIKEENIGQVRARGGRCFALVTEIVGAADIGQRVAALRRILTLS